jgi:hypothetical protein
MYLADGNARRQAATGRAPPLPTGGVARRPARSAGLVGLTRG